MLAPTSSYDMSKLQPAYTMRADVPEMRRRGVRLPGGVTYAKGTVLGEVQVAAGNEIQTLTFGGTVSGGSFILQFDGRSTASIAFNANAAAITAACVLAFGPSSVVVTGTGPFVFTFGGDYQNVNVPMIVAVSALTGTAPTAAFAETTPGSPGLTGCYAAYASGNTDGSQVAKLLLERYTVTDAAGRIVNQFGSTDELTAQALSTGDYYCADLVGLDATSLASLGKLIEGATISTTGAVIRVI